MALDENLRDSKFHFILRATLMSVHCFTAIDPIVVGTFHLKPQPHGGTRGKVRGSPKSVGNHECLHKILYQSIF